MNVHCNCLVINQCDEEMFYEEFIDNTFYMRLFCTRERGLSKSRNMAIKYAKAEIVCIADDDLYYYDEFDKVVLKYYENNKDADIVLFNVDDYSKTFSTTNHNVNFFELLSFISIQCSFKLESIKSKNICFNELFGSGSRIFSSGEENILLTTCYKNRLKMKYCSDKILKLEESESTWFTSFNDKKFIMDRGAIFYAIDKILYYPFTLYFAVKYHRKLKPYNFFQSIKIMRLGKNKYLNIIKNGNK